MAQKLVHKRSNQPLKAPTGATLDYGEIAVNYNVQSPFLSIKNSDNTYSKFSSDDIIAAGMVEYVSGELKGYSVTGHTHDDRYYTETEINTKLAGKSDTGHTHTKAQITDFTHTHKKSEITDFEHTHGTVTLTGDVTGSADFTNTGTSISVTVKDDSHTHDDRYYTETEVDAKIKAVNDTIEDNELTTSAALNELNERVLGTAPAIHTHKKSDITDFEHTHGTVTLTYDGLVTLRNSSQLISGQQYRITDYVTTTSQENTTSAGHQFDVIVTADDESTLNEIARAIQHDGDTYFAENDLNAWQIWYCIDNDTNRFTWADAINGKGIIYRMIDEFDNDIPYDFKNILYIDKEGFKYNQWGENYQFTRNSALDKVINGTQYYGYSSETTPIFWSEGKCWITDIEITPNTQLYKEDGSAISFGGTISNIITQDIEYYTFRKNNEDDSLYGVTKDNVVKAIQQNGIQLLNKNIFGVGCCSNKIGYNSLNNTFGDNCCENTLLGGCIEEQGSIRYCANNSFGNGCCLNVFGYVTFSNTFGENCNRNSFENGCYGNSFGNECESNSFGNSCYLNSFGNSCNRNSFENGCYGNSFGNECESNSFGNHCYSNSFGESYRDNSFGDYCTWNIFDANCWRNRFNNCCYENTFGENCNNNSFSNSCYGNSFGNHCCSNSFGNSCDRNSFENGCDNNRFGNGCYENSFGNGCLYNSFGNHCYSNSFGESCESNSFGESCESNSFGESCESNSFGNGCNNNSFRLSASEIGTLKNYCSYNHFDDGCSYNIIWNGDTTNSYRLLKNININRGVSGSNYNFININTLNADYEIQVAKNSSGVIKVYCEADLIA